MLANAVRERALELSFAAVQLYLRRTACAGRAGLPSRRLPGSVRPVEILDVESEERDGLVHVALRGELDLSTVGKVEDELERVEADGAARARARPLASSSSSTRPACAASSPPTSAARAAGRRVVIVRGPGPVQRVFTITRLEERLEMVDDAWPSAERDWQPRGRAA